MTRRHAWLAIIGLCLSWQRVARATTPGVLTIDLNQWDRVEVIHGTETHRVLTSTLFRILKETT